MQQEQKKTIQKFKALKILDIVTSSKFINLLEFWIKSNRYNQTPNLLFIYVCIQIPNHDPNAMQSRVCWQGKLTLST